MTSTFHLVGAMAIAFSMISLIMSVSYNMQVDGMETVIDAQVQGNVEILKNLLRDEFRSIGVGVPEGQPVFETSLSSSWRVSYYTGEGEEATRVDLYIVPQNYRTNNPTYTLVRSVTPMGEGKQSTTTTELPIRGIAQLRFSYYSTPDVQTTQPDETTRIIGVEMRLQSAEPIDGEEYVVSVGAERVLLRQLLYRES